MALPGVREIRQRKIEQTKVHQLIVNVETVIFRSKMTELHSPKYNLDKGWQAILKDLNIPVQDVLRYAQLPLDLLLRKTPAG